MPTKRKPKPRRAPPRRSPKRSRVPKRKPKPKPKHKAKPKRSRNKGKRPKPKTRKPATRKRRQIPVDDRDSDMGDVEVASGDWEPADDYEPHPVPDIADLRDIADRAMEAHGEIEWFPRFDEVYDYIDALVEEYDLDAHELFEMAFGYSDQDQT